MSTETIVDLNALIEDFFGILNIDDFAEIQTLAGTSATTPGLKALDDRLQEVESASSGPLDIQEDGSSRRLDDIELFLVGVTELLSQLTDRDDGRSAQVINHVAADITVTESTFTTLGLPDFVLGAVRTGDIIMFTANFKWEATAETGFVDILIAESADFVSSGTGTALTSGIKGWEGVTGTVSPSGGPFLYVVQADDISASGHFSADVVARTAAAGDKLIEGGANDQIQFAAVNLSH